MKQSTSKALILSFMTLSSWFSGGPAFAQATAPRQSVNLGQEVKPNVYSTGEKDFGAFYSYGPATTSNRFQVDFGFFYGFSLSAKQVQELPAKVKINFYDSAAQKYLWNWSTAMEINKDEITHNTLNWVNAPAEYAITHLPSLELVFAGTKGNAFYHLSLATLCRENPETYLDMTDAHRTCSQLTPEVVAQAKTNFCHDSTVKFQEAVKEGRITCQEAKEKFPSQDCGALTCVF